MRNRIVAIAQSLIGKNEFDGSHRSIIDTYNSIVPLPAGYRMSYADPWCAAFVSAVGKMAGINTIILPECSCDRMINKYKNAGRWVENDAYVPSPGDLIFYDWQDNGIGDNVGSSDHVGIVEAVNGCSISVIEGNISDAVGRRMTTVNARYIRGYAVPAYVEESTPAQPQQPQGKPETKPVATAERVSTGSAEDEKIIWDKLVEGLGNEYGAAAMMGNLFAESALISNNFEDYYERRLGYNNASYTAAVDNGSYTNFSRDSAGYGIAQWTFGPRKENLYLFSKRFGKSVGDLYLQLDFLLTELNISYGKVLAALKNASNIRQASDVVLVDFENPSDKSEAVRVKRAEYGQKYYDKYAKAKPSSPAVQKPAEQKETENLQSDWEPKVGDLVMYNGCVHYVSANSTSAKPCVGGLAKVTQIYYPERSRHPYHLIYTAGGGATVYGWVDRGSFVKA